VTSRIHREKGEPLRAVRIVALVDGDLLQVSVMTLDDEDLRTSCGTGCVTASAGNDRRVGALAAEFSGQRGGARLSMPHD
jgi:diaminopimelate epimerase